jgi:hypothetical protein
MVSQDKKIWHIERRIRWRLILHANEGWFIPSVTQLSVVSSLNLSIHSFHTGKKKFTKLLVSAKQMKQWDLHQAAIQTIYCLKYVS